ncbi:hypothetical protein T4A_9443 [Trichinella pseudospiralis]|uniref:Uncharacterized protein n=1 Tax=Trichinella pseudospiralis TaxID=6337 RepID=A0A0V1E5Z4_TRIPS|nr:hypothetical protein T4A_9443 [Trichinella pseudospiralis]
MKLESSRTGIVHSSSASTGHCPRKLKSNQLFHMHDGGSTADASTTFTVCINAIAKLTIITTGKHLHAGQRYNIAKSVDV